MRGKNFLDKMELVDSGYVEEADTKSIKKKPRWIKWGAMAACLCLVVVGAFIWKQSAAPITKNEGITVTKDGVTIPLPELSLSSNVSADMLAFFIYQGRVYTQYEWVNDSGVIAGERLGTATGLIDEWTPKDGYVELAGSVSGDFYTVNGFDPSFMLCMKYDDGQISTYICNRGITLKYGSELYEDRLHLSENYVAAEYESRESWYYSRGEVYALDADGTEILNGFISKLNSAEFIPSSNIPLDEGESSIYDDKEIYHLYLKMQNGMTVELRLFEGGYVSFQGILDICVQVPQNEFNTLISLFVS